MKAGDAKLQTILNSPNQYIIPVFQRYYTWGKKEWNQLWEDIEELSTSDQSSSTHFMGVLVFVPEKHDPIKVPAYQVIDGQQRLITISILLSALRDYALIDGYKDLADEITQSFLVHRFKKGTEYYRIFPRQRDRNEYFDIINNNRTTDGQLFQAFRFFFQKVHALPDSASEKNLKNFFSILQSRLEFVSVTLDDENPYRIFKSLNSTGIDLSEADLIRNFIFMHVKIEDQDLFDDQVWSPLESHFKDKEGHLKTSIFSNFFRDYLMMTSQYVPLNSIYYVFEKRYETKTFNSVEMVNELNQYVDYYDIIRGINIHSDNEIEQALQKLRDLDS